MKKLFKILIFSTALLCLPVDAVDLTVEEGDFIQGEFSAEANNGLDLSVDFPDHSQRLLARNVQGKRLFMLVAESSGTLRFNVTDSMNSTASKNYRLHIERQIPRAEQVALPPDYLSPTIRRLAEQLASVDESQHTKLLNEFWQKVARQGTPLIENSRTAQQNLVTFLWRGAQHNVILWGGPTADHTHLQRLLNTDIWFATFDIPNDTLLSYGFAPDVPTLPLPAAKQRRTLLATLQTDPFNLHSYPNVTQDKSAVKILDRFNRRATLRLAAAPKSDDLQTQDVAHGKLQSTNFHSDLLYNSRRIIIYTPVNFTTATAVSMDWNLLFFFDAADYLEQIPTPTILDNMQASGKLTPTIAVFIDSPSYQTRADELPPNPRFAQMLAEELYPWVTQRLGINPSAKRTALIGSSYGGLAATYVASRYPHLFGNVLAMSGSFWWKSPAAPSEQNNYVAHYFATHAKLPLKFFISAGRYETLGNEQSILANSRQLKDVLIAKGYEVTYREYSSGHDYFAWQTILSDSLYSLLSEQ
ncbi:alpha/beta hydrolase-fold protein [Pasteurellaceae bacterium LIM206]|nr:alpha/beta hydrolase-fold protein [Pasteurellaceae bacterium LIM206]